MYQFLNNSHAVDHALIGCGCSVATLPVAEISHYWSIPHVISLHHTLVLSLSLSSRLIIHLLLAT